MRSEQSLLRQRFGVRRVGLFGSAARNTSHPESDVDVLVEFEESACTYDNLLALHDYLSEKFDRDVDLVTPDGLSAHIRPHIEADLMWA
jgi:hypothetical protein